MHATRSEDKDLKTVQGIFQVGMKVLGSTSENFTEVTWSPGWKNWISRYVQFFEGSSVGNREGLVAKTVQFLRGACSGLQEACLEKLRNLFGELAAGYGSAASKDYAMLEG